MDAAHRKFMSRALELAARGKGHVSPNPLVGAVIVKDGQIAGEGWHAKFGEAHAELHALREAGEKARGGMLYISLEPCSHYGKTPPCTDQIIASGISEVFLAMVDPNPMVAGSGMFKLQEAGIKVHQGLMEEEALLLNETFVKFITQKIPFVTLKCALSLDGKLAAASGDSHWISSDTSRQIAHELRHEADVLAVGIGTIRRDNPQLTCRLSHGNGMDPHRLIIDPRMSIDEKAKVLHVTSSKKTILAVASIPDTKKEARLTDLGVEILVCHNGKGQFSLNSLLHQLGANGVANMVVEGGGKLFTTFIEQRQADKLIIFFAPKLIGGDGISFFHGPSPKRIKDTLHLRRVSMKMVEDDVMWTGYF